MYDYYGYESASERFLAVFTGNLADSAATDMISYVAFALSFIALIYIAAAYVASAVLFMKAGEAPWKSLIPVYDTYTYFKLSKKNKLFIPYIIALVCGYLGYAALVVVATRYSWYGLGSNAVVWICIAVNLILILARFVMYILLNINIAKAFDKSVGFTIGLVLLNTIFKMILAFGTAKYKYVEEEPEITGYRKGYIEFLTGDRAGARKELLDGETVIIGRDPQTADFVVDRGKDGSRVSRRHCEVQYAAVHNVFYITDLSSNGTSLEDGKTLLSKVKTPIKRGTTVILPKDIRFIVK